MAGNPKRMSQITQLLRLHKPEQAIFYYRRALEIVPNYPLAIAGLNRIEK